MSNIRSRKTRETSPFSGRAAVRDVVQEFIHRYPVIYVPTYTRGLRIRTNSAAAPTAGATL
jgi:hypothetical protein